jgi:signal transduction histidine kinase
MLRARPAVLAIGLVAVALLALVGLSGDPESGVAEGVENDVILGVDPGSPIWRVGIRPGDRVLALDDSRAPGGWRIETTDGRGVREAIARDYTAKLTAFSEWAVLAFAGSLLIAYLVYRRIRLAGLILPLAFAVAAEPLFYAGHIVSTLVGGAAIYVGGSQAVAAFAPRGTPFRPAVQVTVALGIALGLAWVLAVLAVPALFDPLDVARWPIAIGLTFLGFALIADWHRFSSVVFGTRGLTFLDLTFVAALTALAIGSLSLLRMSPLAVAVGLLIIAAAYPVWRRGLLGAFDRLVTGSARRDAAILATEAERGRFAREIHDVPIQGLAGVIRRLETKPGTAAETIELRAVAASLRDVATGLHPPVLEDLGLAAAIEDHLDGLRSHHPDWSIETSIDDLTALGQPPADVSLAVFRIVQAGVINALEHSGGLRLTVTATIATEAIQLRIADDGHGYPPERLAEARRTNHLGIDSMIERADAIGADLAIHPSRDGVVVDLSWTQP